MKHILFATLFTLIATSFPFAQTQPPALQLTVVTVTNVKQGMMRDYQAFLKNETLPAFKKAGGKGWATYTVGTFGKLNVIITLRQITGMKEYDEPNFILKALGEEGTRVWAQKRSQMIESVETYLLQGLPDVSIPRPNPNESPKLAVVNFTSVAPGRTADYERLLKSDYLPLLKKANSKGFAIGRVLFGGDTNGYRSMSFADSFEELEKMGVALGAAGAGAVAAKTAGIVVHSERLIAIFHPDLSLRPEPPKAANK